MKKRKTVNTIIVVFIILAGLSLMLYPTVSDYINSLEYRRTIDDFKNTVEQMDEDTKKDYLASARAFNAEVIRGSYLGILNDEERERYESLLDPVGTGLMGYIRIPRINISLPIYHGTDEAVLQVGVGHLEGSSLPVGGEGTHAVLSGHTGLPSSKLFTNIDKLVEGDIFTIHVINETLTYEVDQILVILPSEVNRLRIEEGEDYCTLVTCTPYGVNTHRLLVRGHRIADLPVEETSRRPIIPAVIPEDTDWTNAQMLIPAVALVVIAILILLIIRRKRKKQSEKNDL